MPSLEHALEKGYSKKPRLSRLARAYKEGSLQKPCRKKIVQQRSTYTPPPPSPQVQLTQNPEPKC